MPEPQDNGLVVADPKLVAECVRDLANGSGPGPSMWRADWLRPLVTCEHCLSALGQVVLFIANGRPSPYLSSRLLASRLVALGKRHEAAGAPRPVAIGEPITRLAAHYVTKLCVNENTAGSLFPEVQYGVGCSGGAERALHFLRGALSISSSQQQQHDLEKRAVVLSTDMANAFNSISRAAVAKTVAAAQELRPGYGFFRWSYSRPSQLLMYQGGQLVETITSEEGVRQGCSFSAVAFALTVQPLFTKAAAAASDSALAAAAVLDDFAVSGSAQAVFSVLDKLRVDAPALHLQLQPPKCRVLWSYPEEPPPSLVASCAQHQVELRRGSMALWGGRIGQDDEADREWAGAQVDGMGRFFSRVVHTAMSAQVASLLIRYSGSALAGYMARVLPTDLSYDALRRFDNLVLDSLSHVLGITNDLNSPSAAVANFRMRLPLCRGGFGIRSAVELAAGAHACSLARAAGDIVDWAERAGFDTAFVQLQRATLFAQFSRAVLAATVTREQLQCLTQETADRRVRAAWKSGVSGEARLQRQHTRKVDLTNQLALREIADKQELAHMKAASAKGASLWITSVPVSPELLIRNGDYQAAVRNLLMLPAVSYDSLDSCACGIDLRSDPCHFQSCPRLRRRSILVRHNQVAQALVSLARLGQMAVRREPSYRLDDADGIDRPDLTIVGVGCCYLVDVSITHAASPSYVSSGISPQKLIERVEHEKHKKYDGLAAKAKSTLVPFVLTSAGELSERAHQFVKELVRVYAHPGDSNYEYNAALHLALRRISVALHIGNATVLREGALETQLRACGASVT
jgi:hypothetical protein